MISGVVGPSCLTLPNRIRDMMRPWSRSPLLKMSHQHHQDCGHEAHDHDHNHDHDHDDPQNLGYQDNLFAHIDRPNVIALNAEGNAADVIKPWNERMDETKVSIDINCVRIWVS